MSDTKHHINMNRSWQSYLVNAFLRIFVKRPLRWLVDPRRSISTVRLRIERLGARQLKPAADVRVSQRDAHGVAGEWIEVPESTSQRVILYLHGGGYVLRTPHVHRALVISLCRQTAARAFMPDYRLAPEHPFPAAVEDCLTCYRWLRSQGHAAERIVVAGDSAGGGLVLATLLALRDAGEPLPGCGVTLSAAIDLTASGWSAVTNRHREPWFFPETLLAMKNHYLQGALPTHPWASPLFANHGGLPPLLVQVGEYEVLLDDSRRFVELARQAGVEVKLEVWGGMPHVFQLISMLPERRRALTHIQEFVRSQTPA